MEHGTRINEALAVTPKDIVIGRGKAFCGAAHFKEAKSNGR
ncbi:hypothetical protein YE105_P0059 (plasmid) [Yersinia enterocolitica subsp. palearctica 105.5R(r)]|uniref:Uncharacterized protein n=1 Tax=Yersinia enterocolitica subsp. palearctica serotype O:3 (strain DSM 13030 / CIP 106945 / Y11) TaxID=930944 RepID=A0A0H3NW94_YERE1|nr:hypothetical protein YE105_P0059 [Yersinia enterocolitica subsp. palearctica 105.5R(r)]CBY78135.1 hypothetical protein Y11_p0381 [Yersinia enterocolitica subsp. palearctica Y11]CQR17687.1 Uncharacterised protein [Yersinia enterocolitica]